MIAVVKGKTVHQRGMLVLAGFRGPVRLGRGLSTADDAWRGFGRNCDVPWHCRVFVSFLRAPWSDIDQIGEKVGRTQGEQQLRATFPRQVPLARLWFSLTPQLTRSSGIAGKSREDTSLLQDKLVDLFQG